MKSKLVFIDTLVVLIGEYKRMPRDIDGAVALQKRSGEDFYLRYHAQGRLSNILP